MAGHGKFILSIFYSILFACVVSAIIYFFLTKQAFIGPLLILGGIITLIPLFIRRTSFTEIKPELVFGFVDNGILALTALIGADLFGILGAILGGLIGNAFTDGIAGAFEGYSARKTIKLDPITTSLGKMSGCLIGAGVVIFIAWTVI